MKKFSLFFIVLMLLISGHCLARDAQGKSTGGDSQIIDYLEFREMDIKDVLRQLSKQYGLNIVFSESVTGLVTVQLSNITIEEALDSIITVNGFAYNKKENVIKVTTPEEAEREGRFTKLFKLNNADAATLKPILKKVLSDQGTIESDARSNSLIVTDFPSAISRVDKMIPDLDKITPQVLIEARFIETAVNTTEKLGIDWATAITATGAAKATTFPFSHNPISNQSGIPSSSTGTFAFGILDFTDLTAIFEALRTRESSRLVANPRITTLDNQRAVIQVGKSVPVAVYERSDDTGKWQITGWDVPERVGIILEVTPQVSPDGHIRLKIKPEVSEIDSWIKIDGEDTRPITNTRTAETEVMIRDNQTVVIGGLIKDKAVETTKKVPLLGDLPFIGKLFTHKEAGTPATPAEKVDLLIFVTARILKDTNKALIGYSSNLTASPPKPFNLNLKNISLKR